MVLTSDQLATVKRVLREDTMPLLSDELIADISNSSDTLDEVIYKGALMKSEDTTLQVSGLSTADTSKYFLRIASMHRPSNTGILGGD